MNQPSIKQMETSTLSQRMLRRKGVVTVCVLLALALTYGVAQTQPFEYQATVRLLIIQNQTENQDLLSTLRATEQVGKGLVDVIDTSSFQDKVYATDFPIKRSTTANAEIRRKDWQRSVQASIAQQSGIITVTVLDSDINQAAVLARAIAQVLTEQSQEYHGKSNIIVKVVDDVYTKRWPVRPNLIGSTLAALFFGLLLGGTVAALLPPKSDKKSGPKQKEPAIIRPAQPAGPTLGAVSGRQALQGSPLRGGPPAGLPVEPEDDENI